MKRKWKVITISVAALAVMAFVVYLIQRVPFEQQAPAVGQMAPELHLADVSGRMVSLADNAGGVTLVNFWAGWCPPCRAELDWFGRVYDDYKDSGFMVIAISVDDISIEQALKLDLPFHVAMVNDRVREAYGGILDVPASFLVGRDGRIIRKVGRPWAEDDLRAAVEQAMGQSLTPAASGQ